MFLFENNKIIYPKTYIQTFCDKYIFTIDTGTMHTHMTKHETFKADINVKTRTISNVVNPLQYIELPLFCSLLHEGMCTT